MQRQLQRRQIEMTVIGALLCAAFTAILTGTPKWIAVAFLVLLIIRMVFLLIKPIKEQPQADTDSVPPDIALLWDNEAGVPKEWSLEKGIIIHNRSDHYVYDVALSPISLITALSFDRIKEIAPGKKVTVTARWMDKSSLTQTVYSQFFFHHFNFEKALQVRHCA